MRFLPILILTIVFLTGCKSEKKYSNPVVVIETKFGNIIVELYPKQAPITTGAFLSYVDSGLYRNSFFYRILREDNQITGTPRSNLIQGGIWHSNPGKQKELKPVPHETTQATGILHQFGTISLARTTPGTATTEFFICMSDEPGFDHGGKNNPDGLGYAAFGKVVEGEETLQRIYTQQENNQVFTPLVAILDIKRGN